MYIGKQNGISRDFNGSIDEIGLWNRALNDSEIEDIYFYGKRRGEPYKSVDFNFRKYNPEYALFEQPDTIIPNVYDPQSLNRYLFERGNPVKNVDPSGHFIIGYQAGGEGAFGPGAGYSTGRIWELRGDGTFTSYDFRTTSFGGGVGGSVSGEGILGPKTVAGDFAGKGYTGQGGFTAPPGYGFGPTWSANVPAGSGGQPDWSKIYVTGGVGFIVGVGGVQAYGGETDTQIKVVNVGIWNPFTSSLSNVASQRPHSSATNSRKSSGGGGYTFTQTASKSQIKSFVSQIGSSSFIVKAKSVGII